MGALPLDGAVVLGVGDVAGLDSKCQVSIEHTTDIKMNITWESCDNTVLYRSM